MKSKIELEPDEVFDFLEKELKIRIISRKTTGGYFRGALSRKDAIKKLERYLQEDKILAKHSNKNVNFMTTDIKLEEPHRWIDFWVKESLFTITYTQTNENRLPK